ncbi:MAG: bifunctional phosphopantothenoylcysteine decarboxylase/phosphopantothenate--cysteine ligase CoaBC [Pseudomonadota bacterium]
MRDPIENIQKEQRSRATSGYSILLIIGGGVAAYKSLELIRLLAKREIGTRAILTRAAAEFVTPLSVGALTGEKVFQEIFDLTDEAEMGHIQLSRSADLLVAAPATADLMAKAANGLANDLASTAILATDKPVLYAPAMNVRMWEHPATQRNLAQLKKDGAMLVGPGEGDMACGEYGFGRMAEPEEIADTIETYFARLAGGPLTGRHILLTAGPTYEPIDPVRYIANRSSGKQGYALARALVRAGAEVTLVSGPTDLPPPAGVKFIRVETAREMMDASTASLPADCAIMCAAVADFRAEFETQHKIKKERGGLTAIPVTENPDILKTISNLHQGRPPLVIGFAAETDDVLTYAQSKRTRKGCDWIVANDVSPGEHSAMGGDQNSIILITEDNEEPWQEMPKDEVARRLCVKIADALDERIGTPRAAE